MTILLFLALLVLVIAGFAFDALLLHVTTKIFKVNGANYKTALIISVFQWISALIISVILGIVLAAFGFGDIRTILTIFFGVVIFHKLLQKYYQTSLKKNIAIYVVFIILTVIIYLIIIIPVRSFIFEPFYVAGKVMEPIYQDGDYLLINKFDKSFGRGDIVVFKNPKKPDQYFIERIVGLPNEKIQLKNGSVYLYNAQNINGYELSESYLAPEIKTYGLDENVLELSSNEYYMLGDNRTASKDSRIIGPVSSDYFIGKVWFKAGKK